MTNHTDFWDTDALDYQQREMIELPPTPELIASIEAELGYRLPASYVALMHTQNGGIPRRTCHPAPAPTSWAEDHIAVSSLSGIGRSKTYSLCGSLGSAFMVEEWAYPALGVYFASCPSAGHDMVALDYRACGPAGEPSVVHVDQEADYHVTWLAPDFATFIRQLLPEEVYADDPEDTRQEDLSRVRSAPFSPSLQALLTAFPDPALPVRLRTLAARLVEEKGFFALHADELSHLMYDVQFLLYSHSRPVPSEAAYLGSYRSMLALTDAGVFGTGGYAPDFVKDWLEAAVQAGRVIQGPAGLQFTPGVAQDVQTTLRQLTL